MSGFEIPRDVQPARWVASSLTSSSYRVGMLVPSSFSAYVRIFHPATLTSNGETREVSWEAIAAMNGRAFHPLAEWGSIVGSWAMPAQEGVWDTAPVSGTLPESSAYHLARVLSDFTGTAEICWFGVWNGWNCIDQKYQEAPEFDVVNRRMHLVGGPLLSAHLSVCQPPLRQSVSLWWPEDRAWFVATDIDLNTTYVGGSETCISEITASNELESAPAKIDQDISWEADQVNPLPSAPY